MGFCLGLKKRPRSPVALKEQEMCAAEALGLPEDLGAWEHMLGALCRRVMG